MLQMSGDDLLLFLEAVLYGEEGISEIAFNRLAEGLYDHTGKPRTIADLEKALGFKIDAADGRFFGELPPIGYGDEDDGSGFG